MNSVYLSLINLCVQSLSRSLSVSFVIWFPLRNVRNKVSLRTNASGHGILVVWPYIHHLYSDKHTSAHEETNLSERGSLPMPINEFLCFQYILHFLAF